MIRDFTQILNLHGDPIRLLLHSNIFHAISIVTFDHKSGKQPAPHFQSHCSTRCIQRSGLGKCHTVSQYDTPTGRRSSSMQILVGMTDCSALCDLDADECIRELIAMKLLIHIPLLSLPTAIC